MFIKKLLIILLVAAVPAVSSAATFYVVNNSGEKKHVMVGTKIEQEKYGLKFNSYLENGASQFIDSGLASEILVRWPAEYALGREIVIPLSKLDRIKLNKKIIIKPKGMDYEQNLTSNKVNLATITW
jgi:hypothetical protein